MIRKNIGSKRELFLDPFIYSWLIIKSEKTRIWTNKKKRYQKCYTKTLHRILEFFQTFQRIINSYKMKNEIVNVSQGGEIICRKYLLISDKGYSCLEIRWQNRSGLRFWTCQRRLWILKKFHVVWFYRILIKFQSNLLKKQSKPSSTIKINNFIKNESIFFFQNYTKQLSYKRES